MDNQDSSKAVKISSNGVVEKEFIKTDSNGYDPEDVDTFLDIVVDTLQYYESNFQRYQAAIMNFDSIGEKVKKQELLINKLRSELSELYNNGYNNQAMMRRIQNIENSQNFSDLNNRLANIEQMINVLIKK